LEKRVQDLISKLSAIDKGKEIIELDARVNNMAGENSALKKQIEDLKRRLIDVLNKEDNEIDKSLRLLDK